MLCTPTDHKILIRHRKPPTTTSGGIILPESSQHKCTLADVIAVGPGVRRESDGERLPVAFHEGQIVMVQTFIGEDMVVDGTEYKLIREPDVLCVVELEGIMPEPLVPSPV